MDVHDDLLGGTLAERQDCPGPRQPQRRVTRAAATAALVALGGLGPTLAGCAGRSAAPDGSARSAPVASASRTPAAGTAPSTPGSAASTPPATAASSPAGTPAVPNPGRLSDRQMVGQLFMTYVYGSGAHRATPAQRAANRVLYGAATPAGVVRRWHLGGVILIDHNDLDPARATLSAGNVDSAAQIRHLTAGLQRAAHAAGDPRLLVATDQEGGRVQRIRDGVDPRPSQQSLAGLGAAALTCSYYHLGSQLRALGVNQDFAPDADVVRTSTGVIGDRSFGPNPAKDAADVVAAVRGLQAAGVLATLKHWPGHGSTSTDSHRALAVVREDAATWRHVDRVPFARAADTAAAVMVGHLALPALDPTGRPATFSPVLTDRLLRHRLGFRGLIVTDSLWMAPARQQGGPGRTALKALAAGNDLLLEPPDLPASARAVLAAVRRHPDVRTRVQDAASRVLAAKARAGRVPGARPSC